MSRIIMVTGDREDGKIDFTEGIESNLGEDWNEEWEIEGVAPMSELEGDKVLLKVILEEV